MKKTTCSKCTKDLGTRYPKYRYCLDCHAAHMRATRPKHSELAPLARQKANVRALSHYYVKRGAIIKEPCKCGDENSQMHHSDYSNPFDVTWLCRPCHLAVHA